MKTLNFKLSTFIIILLVCNLATAQITIEECHSLALNYGNPQLEVNSIPTECVELIYTFKHETNFSKTADNKFETIGSSNILISKVEVLNPDTNLIELEENIISGTHSRLSEIIAVDLDQTAQKVLALNNLGEDKEILTYSYLYSGNISPLRRLSTPEIGKATNFKFTKNEIFVISKNEGWIKVFNSEADPQGKRETNSNEVLRSIQGELTQLSAPMDIESSDTHLFVLNKDQILIFKKSDKGDIPPTLSVSLNQDQIASRLNYDKTNDILNIELIDDSIFEININELEL